MIQAADKMHDKVLEILKKNPRYSRFLLDVGGSEEFCERAEELGYDSEACGLEYGKKCDLNKQKLPYQDALYDVTTCIEVIEHVENPRKVIDELARVTVKGGMVVLTFPNLHSWYQQLYFLFTGGFHGYDQSDDRYGVNHISPMFSQIYTKHIEKHFVIEQVTANRSFIPLLMIPLPFKSQLFGDSTILVLRKK
jgi:SAM-dependent methyltransferase